MFTKSSDAFRYFEDFTNFERTNTKLREYRLDRMNKLLDDFDHPERSFKSFHIAGSKGKGTTSALIASALKANGIKTGLFTSPHVLDYRERITLAGTFFPEQVYIDNANLIYNYLESGAKTQLPGNEEPTTFELLTLLAFLMFRNTGCAFAVLETGLGGRLDTTNLVNPVACVITNIELEHTSVLGNTIKDIASEKAGIIKKHIPVIVSANNSEAVEIISSKAKKSGAELLFARDYFTAEYKDNNDFGLDINISFTQNKKDISGHLSFRSAFTGEYSALNAASAALAVKTVLPDFPNRDLEKGFSSTKLKGRNEIWHLGDKTYIFDAAHTPASIKALIKSVQNRFKNGGLLVFGLVQDKNPDTIIPLLLDWPRQIIITRPGSFKESNPESLFNKFLAAGCENALLITDTAKAVRTIEQNSHNIVLVTGSFYLIAEVQKNLLLSNRGANGYT
jgi:dihydrofolate synthase / folylpolyglutamate synthase